MKYFYNLLYIRKSFSDKAQKFEKVISNNRKDKAFFKKNDEVSKNLNKKVKNSIIEEGSNNPFLNQENFQDHGYGYYFRNSGLIEKNENEDNDE